MPATVVFDELELLLMSEDQPDRLSALSDSDPDSESDVQRARSACPVPHGELRSARAEEASHLVRLIARIAEGDSVAFASLYDLTSARIFGMAVRVLRDQALAEDTTQEVFLQVWRGAGSFDPTQGTPLSWLMTLAHRRAVDRVRSEQAGSDREALYGSANQTSAHDEVLESVTQRLETEAVAECLKTLTLTQRESVHMAYYQGSTYREVAERLGVAVPTVKSRIRAGFIKLRACLGVS